MNPEQLLAWRTDMKLNQRDAASGLGLSLKGYQELERGSRFGTEQPVTIDRRTALACAAIRFGLDPEGG